VELIAYYRVSTARQGESGLGLEAQRAKVQQLAADRRAVIVLRLNREAAANGMGGFLFCDLPGVDATTSAGRLILSVMASVAEFEGRRISERTREALAAAKARGVKLGGIRPNTIIRNDGAKAKAAAEAEQLRPLLAALKAQGASLREMAAALAGAGCTTRNGKPLSASTVRLQLQRLELAC
jgi:DNA invertase Pin-like site-specific DNA recombinase